MPVLRTLFAGRSQISIAALVGFCTTLLVSVGLVVFLPQFQSRATLDVPQILTFQGKLTDDERITVGDGAYNMKFAIYNAASGGTCLWSADDTDATTSTINCSGNIPEGAISVTISQGNFSVLLGDVTDGQNALPDALFDDNATLYLGITIGGDAEMTPRIRIASTAYALQAGDADLLDGFDTTQVGGSDAVLVTNASGSLVLTLADDEQFLRLISAGDEVGMYGGSTIPTFSAEGGSLYLLDDNAGTGTPGLYVNTSTTDTGTDWSSVLLASGITLDSAYDGGGSGAGRSVTVDSGALELVGSNPADYTLTASNSDSGGVFLITNTGVGASFYVEDEAADATPFVIDGSGNVAIGDSSADTLLTVAGDGNFDGDLVVGSSTSLTETLANAGFSLGGDDLFVAGTIGSEGSVYTDGSFVAGSTTSLADGSLVGTSNLTIDADGFLSLNTTNDGPITTGAGSFQVNGKLKSADHAANKGFKLPVNAGAPSGVTGTAEGDIVWDSTGDALYVYNGTAFTQIGGGGSSDLDTVYSTDSDKVLSVNTSTGLLFDLDSTGAFQVRNASNVPIFSVDDSDANIEFGDTSGNLSRNINIYNGNESATQTNFTQALTNAGILIETNYTSSAYTPGLFWSNSDNNATRPKGGVYLQETNFGTVLYLGTSSDYSTGITRNLTFDYNGLLSTTSLAATGTITATGNITSSTGRIVSAAHAASQGLKLPTFAGTPSAVTGTVEGDIVWNSTGDVLYVYNGSAFTAISGGGSSDLDAVYDADSDKVLSVDSATGLFFDLDLGDFSVRNSSNVPILTVGTGGTTTIANNLVVDTSTLFVDASANRVGIGDATPLFPLVVGSGELFTVSTLGYLGIGTGSTAATEEIEIKSADPYVKLQLDGSATTGGLYVASTAAGNGLKIYYENSTGDVYFDNLVASSSTADIIFRNHASSSPVTALTIENDGDLVAGASNAFFVDNDLGRVGIGDVTPSALFTVGNGDLFTVDSSGNVVGAGSLTFDTDTLFVDASGDNVGIGTLTPGDDLEINSTSPYVLLQLSGSATTGGITIASTAAGNGARFSYENSTGVTYLDSLTTSLGDTDDDIVIRTKVGGVPITALTVQSNGDIKAGASNGLFVDNSAGFVGIRNTAPGQELEVDGDIRLDFNGTATTNGVCHSGAASDTTATDRDLVVCSGAPSDIAEWYETDGAEAGEIMVATGTTITFSSDRFDAATGLDSGEDIIHEVAVLARATEPYQGGVIGIVSTSPYRTFGTAIKQVAQHPEPIALSGRVPVKVSTEGGVIAVGDAITTSSVAGVGMRANYPGPIIGYALSSYTGAGTGSIEVFVSPGQGTGRSLITTGYTVESRDDLTFTTGDVATEDTPSVDSTYLAFRGSGWNEVTEEADSVGFFFQTQVTDADAYRLSLRTLTDAEVAYVTGDGTFGVSGDVVVGGRLYPSDRGTPQTSKYIYYDGDTGPGGDFIRTNASGWATGSYDFAELFPSKEVLNPGEVVVFAETAEHVKKSKTGYATNLAGIISTRPGFLAGENLPNQYPVALAGRVPTKVSAENGPVAIGDPLTSSATLPGYAMKATRAGQIVGYALEALDGPPSKTGTMVVFVRVSYADPALSTIVPGTTSQASSSPTKSSKNLSSLDMEGNIYLHGHDIVGISRLASVSTTWEMDSEGRLSTHGSLDVLITSFQNEDVRTHAKLSTEHVVTLSGSGVLHQGVADMVFENIDPSFNDIISTTAPIRVLVTLRGPANGLFVSNADHNGFSVQETLGGVSDAEFDWYVEAYRKDFEPIEDTEEVTAGDEEVEEPVVEDSEGVEEPITTDTPEESPVVDDVTEELLLPSEESVPEQDAPTESTDAPVEEPVQETPPDEVAT